MSKPRPFHRLFGLAWMDLFQGTTARVEPELDMATQQMLLDVAISLDNPHTLQLPLPDGCDSLDKHNILTFKSYQEALDSWTLLELIHHYVSRRHQVSPQDELLPQEEFRVIAVCVRRPHLLGHLAGLVRVRAGVYDLPILDLPIRLIVIHELPLEPHNAMLHLFSARDEGIRFGMSHYRQRSTETSALICELFKHYLEDPDMSNPLKEFAQKAITELLASLPLEERLQGISAEQRLQGVSAEELRKRLSPRERLADLSADEVLQGLSPEALEALVRKIKTNGAGQPSE